jgi:hypothetical protein
MYEITQRDAMTCNILGGLFLYLVRDGTIIDQWYVERFSQDFQN